MKTPKTTNSANSTIREKITSIAEASLIAPNKELYSRIEEEVLKYITPELIEKVRVELIKKAKATVDPSTTGLKA